MMLEDALKGLHESLARGLRTADPTSVSLGSVEFEISVTPVIADGAVRYEIVTDADSPEAEKACLLRLRLDGIPAGARRSRIGGPVERHDD